MILQLKTLSIWQQLGLVGIAIIVCLLGMHIVFWHPMDQSVEELQQEVARLDQENKILIKKVHSLKTIERDVIELREKLSAQVKKFSRNIESKAYRRDVVNIAKRRNVLVRTWKPDVPLGLPHSEIFIPITVRIEGDFEDTVQFLDELRHLSWVQSIASLVMDRSQRSEDSSLLITSIAIHGLTALGIEHVQNLAKA